MKKVNIMIMLIVVAFCYSSVYGQSGMVPDIYINGERVVFNQSDGLGVPFIDENNRTQVPIRKPLEMIGAKVDYFADTNLVYIEYDGDYIGIQIGADMYLNGETYETDTPARIVESRTYMPIRFVFEALNFNVEWQAGTIYITNSNLLDERDPEALETSEGWRVEPGLPGMGYRGPVGISLPVTMQEEFNHSSSESIQFQCYIYNIAGTPIFLEAFSIECDVYSKGADGVKTLINQVNVSPAGVLGEQEMICLEEAMDLLKAPLASGTYEVDVKFPDEITYYNLELGTKRQVDVKDALKFGEGFHSTYTVQK